MAKKTIHKDLNFQTFDMSWVKDDAFVLILGKRRTGKTVILLDLIFHKRDFPLWKCISLTEELNFTFKKHIPCKHVHHEYDSAVVKRFVDKNKEMKKKKVAAQKLMTHINHYNQLGVINYDLDPRYAQMDLRAFLILDDCIAEDQELRKDATLKWLGTNGRHADMLCAITTQYPNTLGPVMRGNGDFFFIMAEPRTYYRRQIYDSYASVIPTRELFNRLMDKITKNRGCMVIDNSSNESTLENIVFSYKAPLRNEFRVGGEKYEEDLWLDNDLNMITQLAGPEIKKAQGNDLSNLRDKNVKFGSINIR